MDEIVVVDDSSGDGGVSDLKGQIADPRGRVVEYPLNGGLGQGANLGARASTSSMLLLHRRDAIVPGSLASLREGVLRNPSVAPATYEVGGDLQWGAHGVLQRLKAITHRTNHSPSVTFPRLPARPGQAGESAGCCRRAPSTWCARVGRHTTPPSTSPTRTEWRTSRSSAPPTCRCKRTAWRGFTSGTVEVSGRPGRVWMRPKQST